MFTQRRKFVVRYLGITLPAIAAMAAAIALIGLPASNLHAVVRATNASQQCITCWG